MRYAIKNKKKFVHAYRLGYGSAMEQLLLQEVVIRRLPDGSYELFSKEAVQGKGERALYGDYFKVDITDGRYYPYPNTREFFEANHILVDAAQQLYEQQPKPLQVWQKEDKMCPEIAFLLHAERLQLCPADPEHYFQAELFGARLSTSDKGAAVFYRVLRSPEGTVLDVDFNLISEQDFADSYTLCTASGEPLGEAAKKHGESL